VELLIDVRRQAHAPDAFDISRACAEAQPVQDVQDGAIVGGFRYAARALIGKYAGPEHQRRSHGSDENCNRPATEHVVHLPH
jgi:hypothetical protein